MNNTVLVVPGYRGSGPAHWQSWLESQLPESRRVSGIDWKRPELARWSSRIHQEIDESSGPVWIIAHSFGCLASVVVAAEQPDKVAGAILVAPADPGHFSPEGVRERYRGQYLDSDIEFLLPDQTLAPVKSVIVASENDPWLGTDRARYWAKRWGSVMINLGKAGHINAESGYGKWPFVIDLLVFLRQIRSLTFYSTDEPSLPDWGTFNSQIKNAVFGETNVSQHVSFTY